MGGPEFRIFDGGAQNAEQYSKGEGTMEETMFMQSFKKF